MHLTLQFIFLLSCKCNLSKSPSNIQTQYWNNITINLIVIHLIKLITNSSIFRPKTHQNHPPLVTPLYEVIIVEIPHPSLSTPARSSICQLIFYIQFNRLHLFIILQNLINLKDAWPICWIWSQHHSN